MKTLFIDCNPQFELVFRRVHRADDPEVAVNNDPFVSSDLPRMLDGYGICIDDHSYMPTEVMKACRSL
jgi:D-3-phosphoglycerate dehydrogenase / 2-oxoglutarate reductase